MKKLKTMTFETKKRNRPIATLIKWYSDKESGKVVEARKEIQHRFDYLDWNVQKKILMAFLDAGQSDRQWAYRKIYRQWDKCFLEPIRTLWEEHHENICVWSVVKYFPMDYVKANAELIEELDGYYHLCMRLAEDPSYAIDRSKLNDREYLMVMNNCHRKVNEDEAIDIFFQSVYECWLDDSSAAILLSYKGRNGVLSVFDINAISSIRHVFYTMGFDHLVDQINEWDRQQMSTVYHSDEFRSLGKEHLDDAEFQEKLLAITQKYIMLALDDKYVPGF